jgi:hypothetical protein
MKLEHKRENIATRKRFAIRLFRYNLFAFGLIIFSIGVGVTGYKITADLSWLDSMHMSCMILTGMGPTAEMTTTASKLFSSFYALYSGVALLSITAVFLAPIVHRVLHILHVETDDTP